MIQTFGFPCTAEAEIKEAKREVQRGTLFLLEKESVC
jgi:hypothetical protein